MQLSIRTDRDTLYKIRYVAQYEARSMNSQINTLIKHAIIDFEKNYGKIELDEHEEPKPK